MRNKFKPSKGFLLQYVEPNLSLRHYVHAAATQGVETASEFLGNCLTNLARQAYWISDPVRAQNLAIFYKERLNINLKVVRHREAYRPGLAILEINGQPELHALPFDQDGETFNAYPIIWKTPEINRRARIQAYTALANENLLRAQEMLREANKFKAITTRFRAEMFETENIQPAF